MAASKKREGRCCCSSLDFAPLTRQILKTRERIGHAFDWQRATKVGRDAAASLPILVVNHLGARRAEPAHP
jgi:hypothetical protein